MVYANKRLILSLLSLIHMKFHTTPGLDSMIYGRPKPRALRSLQGNLPVYALSRIHLSMAADLMKNEYKENEKPGETHAYAHIYHFLLFKESLEFVMSGNLELADYPIYYRHREYGFESHLSADFCHLEVQVPPPAQFSISYMSSLLLGTKNNIIICEIMETEKLRAFVPFLVGIFPRLTAN